MKHGFVFGIEDIDPRIGRIEAYAQTWKSDGEKIAEPIDLVYCKDLADSINEGNSKLYD